MGELAASIHLDSDADDDNYAIVSLCYVRQARSIAPHTTSLGSLH